MTTVLLFGIGLVLLLAGGEIFVRMAVNAALHLRLSKAVVGGSIVALGTSLPELAVTVSSAGGPDAALALGTILGSNIANVFLILGLLIFANGIRGDSERLEILSGIMLLSNAAFVALVVSGFLSGIVAAAFLGLSIYLLYREGQRSNSAEEELVLKRTYSVTYLVVFALLGAAAVWYGAHLIVFYGSVLARLLGVGEILIGILFVAIGTSLPELAVSFAAVRQKEGGVALGNIIGSNLYNVVLIGGIGGLLGSLNMPVGPLTILLFLAAAFVMFGLTRIFRRRPAPKFLGLVLITIYVIYAAAMFVARGSL